MSGNGTTTCRECGRSRCLIDGLCDDCMMAQHGTLFPGIVKNGATPGSDEDTRSVDAKGSGAVRSDQTGSFPSPGVAPVSKTTERVKP